MADALVSTPVALSAAAFSIGLIALAGKEIKKDKREGLVPLMGVMGAFVFAAQMLNFSIPGTGSSGHIIGGIFLAATLGPWAAFITLVSVLLIQCLVFADGGLMALGCNILNMAACTCLLAYPLVFKPMLKFPTSKAKIFAVSALSCIVGLEAGACGVCTETILSGVTALSTSKFLALMGGIHLLIGLGEGLATGAVICFLQDVRPSLLTNGLNTISNQSLSSLEGNLSISTNIRGKWSLKKILVVFGIFTIIIGGVLCFFASADPDGLEWSVGKVSGETELASQATPVSQGAAVIQTKTAVMPDYENSYSGLAGAGITLMLAWGMGSLVLSRKKMATQSAISANKCHREDKDL